MDTRPLPKATLLSYTENPIETLYAVWAASRSQEPITLQGIIDRCDDELAYSNMVYSVAKKVLSDDIPVAENISFTFLLENIPVALREQLVRNRIGHKFGDNFGVDIYASQQETSFWSQTMRMLDMSKFAEHHNYFTPEAIVGTPEQVTYDMFMMQVEEVYRDLILAGVSPEDARMVIPLAATSRLSWTVNLQSLKKILSKRGCWIAQLGMWGPLLTSVVDQLATRIDPLFRALIAAPCLKDREFLGCPFKNDAMNRVLVATKDPEPPCPIFLKAYSEEVLAVPLADRTCNQVADYGDSSDWAMVCPSMQKKYVRLNEMYSVLWGTSTPS